MKPFLFSSLLLVALLPSCGGSEKKAEAPESESQDGTELSRSDAETSADGAQATAAEEDTADGPAPIALECHEGSDPCTADPKWVKKLCSDVYPAVALYLNQPESPFTRGYMTRKTRAVNASGGVTSGAEWLQFDEEVVLLVHREKDLGGMQVSGAGGGYDALRWDGSCVTLGAGEVRTQEPPSPKHAKIPWRYLGDDVQDALKEVPEVREAYIARKQECKGVYSGSVSAKCVQKDKALMDTIVEAVQGGEADIPLPQMRP